MASKLDINNRLDSKDQPRSQYRRGTDVTEWESSENVSSSDLAGGNVRTYSTAVLERSVDLCAGLFAVPDESVAHDALDDTVN